MLHDCTSSQPDKRLTASLPTNPCEAWLHVPHIRRSRPAIHPSRVPGTGLPTDPENGACCTGQRNALHWPSQRAVSAIAAYCVPLSETAQKTEEKNARIREAESGIPDSPLGRAERSILPIRHSSLHKTTNRSPTGSSPPKGRLTGGFSLPFSSFIHRNAPFLFPIRRKMCNFAHSLSD